MSGGVDWAMRALGAFHAVGGVFVLKQLADGRILDSVLAALTPGPRWPGYVRTGLLTLGGVLTVLGGVALLAPAAVAVPLMIANVVAQAAWLGFAAVWFAPEDDDDRAGRRRTTQAFVLYFAATVAIVWAERQGGVRFVDDGRIGAGLAALGCGLAVWQIRSILSGGVSGRVSQDAVGEADDASAWTSPRFDPPTRILLQPSVGCWPLWDADTGRNLPPEAIGLPQDLVERIAAFEEAVLAALDVDHEDGPRIVDPAVEAGLEPTAIALARDLAKIFGDDNVAWRMPGDA